MDSSANSNPRTGATQPILARLFKKVACAVFNLTELSVQDSVISRDKMFLFRGFVFRRHLVPTFQTLQLSTKKDDNSTTSKTAPPLATSGGESSQVFINAYLSLCLVAPHILNRVCFSPHSGTK